jgi:hypothetical protein
MSDLTFVQGDTAPAIRSILKKLQDDGTYAVLNLTSAGVTSIKFQMRKEDDVLYQVDAAAEVVDAAAGSVRYVWAANDLSVPGDYIAQWELTFSGGKVQTTDPAGTITVRRQ